MEFEKSSIGENYIKLKIVNLSCSNKNLNNNKKKNDDVYKLAQC